MTSTHSLAQFESVIHQLKVVDLQTLLTACGANKFGKKNELQARVNSLLQNPTTRFPAQEEEGEIGPSACGGDQYWSQKDAMDPFQERVVARILEMTQQQRRFVANHQPAPYHQPAMRQTNQVPQQHHNPTSYNPYERPRVAPPHPTAYPPMHSVPAAAHHHAVSAHYGGGSVQLRHVHGVNPMPLPFYDRIRTITEPYELPPTVNGIKQTMKLIIPLDVPVDLRPHLIYRSEVKPPPRMELQLRFFYTGPDNVQMPQHDDFPLNCSVRIEELPVTLPAVIPTNKPNAEPKRPSRPVNITPQLQSKGLERQQRLIIEWTGDRRHYAAAVYAVNRITADELKSRMVNNTACHIPVEKTRMSIASRLSKDNEDGIETDILKTTVKCPLGRTRIGIPARGKACIHHQCFDLDNFLQMNEKRPTWKCPVCSGDAFYSNLIIDQYFENMLKEVPDSAEEVQLLEDGSWRLIVEQSEELSDSDRDTPGTSAKAPSSIRQPASVSSHTSRSDRPSTSTPQPSTSASTPQLAAAVSEVITIDDSDDEDTAVAIAASLEASKKSLANVSPAPSDDSVVCIDLTTPPKNNPTPSSSSATSSERPRTSIASPPPAPPVNPATLRDVLDGSLGLNAIPTPPLPPQNGSLMNGNLLNGQNGYMASFGFPAQQLWAQQVQPMPAYLTFQQAFAGTQAFVQNQFNTHFAYQPQDLPNPQQPQ